MADIVERLRILADANSSLLSWQRAARENVVEAADEIERLRAALTQIERITWREGNNDHLALSRALIDIRKIAKGSITALNQTAPTGGDAK